MVSKIEKEKTRKHIDMMIHISGSASWSDSPLFVQKTSKKNPLSAEQLNNLVSVKWL